MACNYDDFKNATDAQARAYYACRYFEAVEKNALTNLAIQGIQQALAIYIADKQYEVQKQAQDRLDEQWENQKQKSDIYFNLWNDNAVYQWGQTQLIFKNASDFLSPHCVITPLV